MTTVSPTPPGQLGVAARPSDLLDYLGKLDAWVTQRRSELNSLDEQIVATQRQAELTADVSLALALWQAVKSRQDLILRTWDSGRVGHGELEGLSGLIWGRLDTAGSSLQRLQSMAVSLPEAGRLCDALVAQLRTRLNTDPHAEQQLLRLRDLRAQLERIRDQIALEPPSLAPAATARLDSMRARADELSAKRQRGGDIGGLLGPLEIDAARHERDLIVGSAQRREGRDLVTRAREQLAGLTVREQAVRQLADQASLRIWPAPQQGVPALAGLGSMPNTKAALTEYLSALEGYAHQLEASQRVYSAALDEAQRAKDLLSALTAKAAALGQATDPTLVDLAELTSRQFTPDVPVVLSVVNHLVGAYSARLDFLKTTRPASVGGTP
ncbi:MAG: hypothetical protein WCF12_01780 [Propionicimonas sp.]